MGFKTKCFIKVETDIDRKSLIDWLKEIGYQPLCDTTDIYAISESKYIILCEGKYFSEKERQSIYPIAVMNSFYFHDCEENIELFKSLAAINDENDKYQWFIDSNGFMTDDINTLELPMAKSLFRKATESEIIQYFRDNYIYIRVAPGKIRFRGKRTDNGEWVYGRLQYGSITSTIVDFVDLHERCNEVFGYSVGKSTGLRDKNGRDIYQGDIFIEDNTRIVRTIFQSLGGLVFEKNPLSFGYDHQSPIYPSISIYRLQSVLWLLHSCEVIGNIHDNPELLKTEK